MRKLKFLMPLLVLACLIGPATADARPLPRAAKAVGKVALAPFKLVRGVGHRIRDVARNGREGCGCN